MAGIASTEPEGTPRADRPPRWLPWAAVAAALLPFLTLVARFDFLCDDAYITFRYARNLARGLGAVYNPGVDPPVEGYSEFLWVVLLSWATRLGVPLEVASRALSATAATLLVTLVVLTCARRTSPTPWALFATALFLGTLTPLAVWSTGGMSTAAFALALFLAYERLYGDPALPRGVAAGLAAAAVVLLRADGALWIAALLGMGLVAAWRQRDACLARAAGWAVGISLATFLVHMAWRWSTYRDWVPNTARVKVGFDLATLERGARYVGSYVATMPSLLLALALPFAFGRRCLYRPTLVALGMIGATVGYATLVGGDFMCFGRFLIPALPFLALPFSRAAFALEEDGRRGLLALATLGLATLSVLPAWDVHVAPEGVRKSLGFRHRTPEERFQSEYEQWEFMKGNAARWVLLGRALALHTDPEDSIVLGAIGAAGYHSDRFVYDRYGLVTRGVEPEDGDRLSSPGHDLVVPRTFFRKFKPTYQWAKVDRGKGLPKYALRFRERLRVIPLRAQDGFPAGSRLLLIPVSDDQDP